MCSISQQKKWAWMIAGVDRDSNVCYQHAFYQNESFQDIKTMEKFKFMIKIIEKMENHRPLGPLLINLDVQDSKRIRKKAKIL